MNSPTSSAHEGERRGRERRCVATGETLPEAALIRFALAPDGVVTPDVAAKLPGRGVWVRADRASLEMATRKGGFARGFKEKVKVPEGLGAARRRHRHRRNTSRRRDSRKTGIFSD